MDSRELFDLALVVLAGLLAYTETFGFADPRATLEEILAVLVTLDVRVYLVLGGLFGIAFVAYLVVYLPKKDARSMRP
ncbi:MULTISPECIES: hypothetical protein [Haloarcula]|uniref:Uncharacterized protein n=1 Tax=Haloarcula pellucida TaxID=1427151 RepID=A0A830GK93_9EURY|nr:hypothetical protein [Halomicroarcula pellucida]MBX0348888.1 hypothetical protein [Halomicroarcula pellucida]QIO21029.1 hypothetical protein G9465_01040 [Haloarcula sp. JP-L23]GGN91363.1 hypothetical protein GCM10009030_14220 [Halomicroarcula pellucida]